MATLPRNTFAAGDAIIATDMNTNFTNVEGLVNDVLDGTESHSNFTSTGTASLATVNATGTVTAGAFSTTGNATAATFIGAVQGNVTGDVTGRADTATALHTARTIGGVSFNGTANINLPGVNTAGNQDTSGNADTATKLAATKTIDITGVTATATAFDGSANISIPITAVPTSLLTGTIDADELGGQAAANYLRSNADDTTTGRLTINNSNVGSAGNQAINILDNGSTGDAGLSFRYPNNSPVQHGVFRMSNASVHRFVFLQENNASLADAQLQNLYYSGSLVSTSDETLKNNEGPALGLSFVNRLAPFTGTWIDGDDDKHQFLGAQSVQAALTAEGVNAADYGMIGDDSEIGPRTMSYMELVPVLVQAVNELTDRLEAIEAA